MNCACCMPTCVPDDSAVACLLVWIVAHLFGPPSCKILSGAGWSLKRQLLSNMHSTLFPFCCVLQVPGVLPSVPAISGLPALGGLGGMGAAGLGASLGAAGLGASAIDPLGMAAAGMAAAGGLGALSASKCQLTDGLCG
jgi:hypothetical protein